MNAARVIGEEHIPLVNALVNVLDEHAANDPVRQQIALELLITRHAMRAGPENAVFVVTSMLKHVRQFLEAQTDVDTR